MRFLVMVFLSLFLMTNVAVAETEFSDFPVNCPKLKGEIESYYYSVGSLLRVADAFRKDGKYEQRRATQGVADDFLDKASKSAAIYTALCK